MLSGGAGTGKSLAILTKLYDAAIRYPRSRIAIVRKTRTSLTETGIVTWEEDILGANHPLLARPINRGHRHSYKFSNGSVVVLLGCDDPEKILSSQWNLIYIQETTDISQAEWEQIGGRLRNPGPCPRQLIGDCNPVSPSHWLYRRGKQGTLKMYRSVHQDNPYLYDVKTQQLTPDGVLYIGRLERTLTGHLRKRFLEGVWAQAQGQVYPEFDPLVNLIDPFPIPVHWTRYVAIDWGYNDPLVIQWWAQDTDGRLYLYREIFRTQTLVEDAVVEFRNLSIGEPPPAFIVCDHDLSQRMTFERHSGYHTIPADKEIKVGVQDVSLRLRPAGDGKPRLFFFRNALAHDPDGTLMAKGLPCCTTQEIDLYTFDAREKYQDLPVDRNNHGCLIAGTAIETDSGPKPIEAVVVGDNVLTRHGYRRVVESGMTARAAVVFRVTLSNGCSVTGTGNHPVWCPNRGWVRIDSLRYGDNLYHQDKSDCHGGEICQQENTKTDRAKLAQVCLLSINTFCENTAPVRVVGVKKRRDRVPVYNLQIDSVPEYFANGVLVHNCDATRYIVRMIDREQKQDDELPSSERAINPLKSW